MNTLRKKASSERGASITFALLLFLVCAIISSIVIVAATAVGGRASRMAEMDQRYYAVNSAAELVRDVLEKTPTTVETSLETVSKVYQDLTPVSDESTDKGSSTTVQIGDDSNKYGEADTTMMSTAARYVAEGASDKRTLATVTLTAPDPTGTEAVSPLDVTITPTLEGDTLTLDIANTNNKTKGTTYMLKLTFKANLSKTTDIPVSYGAPVFEHGKYVMEKTTTQKTITKVLWTLIDLSPTSAASTGGA